MCKLLARILFSLLFLAAVALDSANAHYMHAFVTVALVLASVGLTKWLLPPLQTDGAFETLDFWTVATCASGTYFIVYNDSTAALLVFTLASVMGVLMVVISFGGAVSQRGWREGPKRFFATFAASLVTGGIISLLIALYPHENLVSLLLPALVVTACGAIALKAVPDGPKPSLPLLPWVLLLVAGALLSLPLAGASFAGLALGLAVGALAGGLGWLALYRFKQPELGYFKGLFHTLVCELAPLGFSSTLAVLLLACVGWVLRGSF